ncbi:MAG: hypothetical protein ACK55I_16395 [bacterium]
MNKLNIINTNSGKLEGYFNLTIDKLNDIINGTSEEIICEVLDTYSYKDRVDNILLMCKKLSNEGSLTLKFINATKLCKDVSKGNCGSQFLSNIVLNSQSLFLDSDIIELISQLQDIKIYKMYNDNLYLVVVLKKQL